MVDGGKRPSCLRRDAIEAIQQRYRNEMICPDATWNRHNEADSGDAKQGDGLYDAQRAGLTKHVEIHPRHHDVSAPNRQRLQQETPFSPHGENAFNTSDKALPNRRNLFILFANNDDAVNNRHHQNYCNNSK